MYVNLQEIRRPDLARRSRQVDTVLRILERATNGAPIRLAPRDLDLVRRYCSPATVVLIQKGTRRAAHEVLADVEADLERPVPTPQETL